MIRVMYGEKREKGKIPYFLPFASYSIRSRSISGIENLLDLIIREGYVKENLVIHLDQVLQIHISEIIWVQDFCGPGDPDNSVQARGTGEPIISRLRDEVYSVCFYGINLLPARISFNHIVELRFQDQNNIRVPIHDLFYRDRLTLCIKWHPKVCDIYSSTDLDEH